MWTTEIRMANLDKAHPRRALRWQPPRLRAGAQAPVALLFLLPALIVLGVFHFFPLLYSFYISLHKWKFIDLGYIGLQNYDTLLHDNEFWRSLGNTIYFALAVVPVTMALAIVFSVMLFQKIRFLAFFRTVYFLPYITSSVAAAGIWAWIFNPQYGVANQFLIKIGIGRQRWLQEPNGVFGMLATRLGVHLPGWAQGPSLALVAIAIMTIWSYLGFEIVIFLVGLSGIPAEIYEAARVDGANAWQLLRKISLPLLAPSILLVSIITTIFSFQEFNRIYQMSTQVNVGGNPGGPLGSTQTLVVLMYNQFYSSLHIGYGASIAFALFLILLVLSLGQLVASRRWGVR
jgi:multiple sugar transport system permease protein